MTDILDPALDQIKCCNQIADKLRAAIEKSIGLVEGFGRGGAELAADERGFTADVIPCCCCARTLPTLKPTAASASM